VPERPLLILPQAERAQLPSPPRGGSQLRIPTRSRQAARFAPLFDRLRQFLRAADGAVRLQSDPTSLAPERAIVFEVAGSIDDFYRAVRQIRGLEFLADEETAFEPDDDFALVDTRKGREGADRTDKAVGGRVYLAMPDLTALHQLVRLWEDWEAGRSMDRGFAPFARMFEHLRTLRPWGPQDRIPDDTIAFWQEELARDPHRPVRTEFELWFHEREDRRRTAFETLSTAVQETRGSVIDHAVIPEIAYDGALVDIPTNTIHELIERQRIRLALADEVMFLRPQAILNAPVELEPLDQAIPSTSPRVAPRGEPIGALLDGVPLQGHVRLADRLIIDDPEDLSSRALVNRRAHGTAMASLILHGDLNRGEQSLDRPLYVRPVMQAPAQGDECTSPDRLLVDSFYLAIRRMKEGDIGGAAVAPSVFLVNISMADPRRPFSGPISPWARLLDYLAERFNILFLVSAGNISDPLPIGGVSDWTTFERATTAERERFALSALDRAKHERTLLSPAEALNPLTIGAAHDDDVRPRVGSSTAIDPLDGTDLPNLSSALGLGHRKVVKPEIFFPGGREHIRPQVTGAGLVVQINPP
jgi:hypothetical protein